MVHILSVYEYEVFENKNKNKFLDVNSSYASAYLRDAIVAPQPSHGEGIPRLGVGLRHDLGSLRCGIGAQ